MIVGIGIDVCDIERFAAARQRQPRLLDRVFTEAETHGSPATLAGRFAAKEALAKALGAPEGLSWHHCVVTSRRSGQPEIAMTGSVAARAQELGVGRVHLSITHDSGIAAAVVVCEG